MILIDIKIVLSREDLYKRSYLSNKDQKILLSNYNSHLDLN